MGFEKIFIIAMIVVLSLSSGYLKGKKKLAALAALGLILAFYCMEYLKP